MILVIAEKPSVAQTIAAVLGAKEKKDGFLTGSGYIVSWCVGHLVGLAEAAAYGEQYKKWSFESLPILPEEWQTRVMVDRAELGSAIDRASLIAREGKTNLVCFKIDGETLEVTSNSETGDMEEKMQVSTEGKDLTIAFNVRYITDVLKALSDEQIVMRFNSNVSPCVICPVEGESYLYLVLPVRVFNA